MLHAYRDIVFSITADNGKEFARHEEIAQALEADFFFARPYHSWERGTNENTNGLIRQYLPKKEALDDLDDAKVDYILDRLNNRPRKILAFNTPSGVLKANLS
jgi:IS30 family transposase